MRAATFTFIVMFYATTYSNAQKIKVEKVYSGYKYTLDGNKLTLNDLQKTMGSDRQTYDLMKKAKTNYGFASALGFAGGGFIGWPIGTALANGDPNWTLAVVGVGLVAVSVPLSSSAFRKTNHAVDIYNSSLDASSFHEYKPQFKIHVNSNGLGLSMNF